MFRKHWPLLIAILLLQAVFLFIQLQQRNFYLDDSAEYLQAAENIIENGTLYAGDPDAPVDPALYTKRTPGYPAILAAVRLFSEKPTPVIILQAILSLLSLVIMARMFFSGTQISAWAAGFILLLPSQFIYANLVMSEILLQFILMLMVLSAWNYFRTRKRKFMWSYQLLLVAAILVKPVMYLFVVPNLVLFGVLYLRYRRRLDMISCLAPVVFVILFAGINQQRTGYFHISSIQQINLVNYNTYFYVMEDKGKETAEEVREAIYRHCAGEREFSDYSACLDREVRTILLKNPLKYAVFHAKGMVRFFIDPGRFDIYNFFGIETESGKGFLHILNSDGLRGAWNYLMGQPVHIIAWLLLIALANLLKLAGFLFYLFNRTIRIEFRLLVFLLVGTIAFATGPLGASRFMLPLALLVLGSSLFQYGFWISALRKKRTGS